MTRFAARRRTIDLIRHWLLFAIYVMGAAGGFTLAAGLYASFAL